MQLESTVEPAATSTGRLEQEGREMAPAVVRANGVFRRYGDGDTAVDALRGISLEIPDQRLTAIMGPSG
jgi:ABC-type transport system involved in cytochrome bd biosynthesis fused ATPase/permease subunit